MTSRPSAPLKKLEKDLVETPVDDDKLVDAIFDSLAAKGRTTRRYKLLTPEVETKISNLESALVSLADELEQAKEELDSLHEVLAGDKLQTSLAAAQLLKDELRLARERVEELQKVLKGCIAEAGRNTTAFNAARAILGLDAAASGPKEVG